MADMRLQQPKPNQSDEALPHACRYTAGAAVGSAGAAAARFDVVDFLAAVFLDTGFFFAAAGAAFDLEAFLTGATAFFAAGFAVFLAALTAFAALAVAFFAAAGALSAVSAAAFEPTRKASRFLALAIQPGARPNPDQVFPVFGSAYLATDAVFTFGLVAARLLSPLCVRCSMVKLNSAMMSLTLTIAEDISVFAMRSA